MTAATGISLIIPSHRRGARIGDTLQSIVAQTRRPDEVLIVNDGGWEETRAFVNAEYPACRVLDIEQGGATRARNYGAAQASQPLLMFLDDDDTLLPHAVATLEQIIDAFPQAQAAYADHTYTNRMTGEHFPDHHAANPAFHRLHDVRPIAERDGTRLYGRELYLALLSGNLLQQPWMIHKAAFDRLGGFLPGLHAANDWEFYLRVVRAGPIALGDQVISNHIVESGRPHLTLSPNLVATQMEATRHHLALVGLSDPRAAIVLRKKLALYDKSLGDRARAASIWPAWRHYLRSWRWWPFDIVVSARLVTWPLQALIRRRDPA